MSALSFLRDKLLTSTPASAGEVGIDAAGHLLLHNGTIVDTYLPSSPLLATLANDAVATTETVVATFTLPANYLTANAVLAVLFAGQVSSTATLTYKIRCGTAGTISDALLGTWAATAAGVANAHTTLDALVQCLTVGSSGTAYATGRAYLASGLSGPATASFAAGTVNTTVVNKLTVTVVQSALQTLTSRTGACERIAA